MDTSASYPIGKFRYQPDATAASRAGWIRDIRELPTASRNAVLGLDDTQLDTPYREGGWTVRQVVHHLADSHMNAIVRMKLTLTESRPGVKPYDEKAWATLPDTRMSVDVSLLALEGLHARWVTLLEAMKESDWGLAFEHPVNGPTTLEQTLQVYAWHGRHHVAHVTELRKRMGWA